MRGTLKRVEKNADKILASGQFRRIDDVPVHIQWAGKPPTEMTVKKLRKTLKKYEKLANKVCNGCPINLDGQGIGCYNTFSYPLTANFEEWLQKNYNPPEKYPNPILNIVDEHELDGKEMDQERPSHGGAFMAPGQFSLFQRSEPLPLNIAGYDKTITTTVLMQILMSIGWIRTDLAFSLLVSFGALKEKADGVLDELAGLAMGFASVEEPAGVSILQMDPFNRMVTGPNGEMEQQTSYDVPFTLHDERNQKLFENLITKIERTEEMKPQNEDDPCVVGFKTFLLHLANALVNAKPVEVSG
jgi:hypothetical protein